MEKQSQKVQKNRLKVKMIVGLIWIKNQTYQKS